MAAETAKECSNLPDELWEYIIKFLDEDHYTFKSLSIVSKQLLSITNNLRFSIKITQQTIPFIPQIFQRFSNVTSLNLTSTNLNYFSQCNRPNTLLTQISTFPLVLRSLILSNFYKIPKDGFRALSKKMKNLTSLTCSEFFWINKKDIFFIVDCFPLLEELVLKETDCSDYTSARKFDFVLDEDNNFLALPKLRKISLYGYDIDSQFIDYLHSNPRPFRGEE
ncbi:F-box protein [Medicago truncatula]|uniref:F-box protein n=1 Tax=Medicago truncatula TaxID=3880 RepID=G7JI38_MEDTR|nr:F-box protein [Medicago truncatula]